jgi:hypothetical protein
MTQFSNKYDLEERTAKFGEEIIEFCKNIEQDAITKECQELTMIFQKITSSLKEKK